MGYALNIVGAVVRQDDGAIIPPDPGNADWQLYEAWRAEGNVATPAAVSPAPVPSCLLWQLEAALTAAQWTRVADAVAALGDPVVSAFFAHGTNVIKANSTTLLSLAAGIDMTSDQVCQLVAEASTISIP